MAKGSDGVARRRLTVLMKGRRPEEFGSTCNDDDWRVGSRLIARNRCRQLQPVFIDEHHKNFAAKPVFVNDADMYPFTEVF
jgi:hypothetical protein